MNKRHNYHYSEKKKTLETTMREFGIFLEAVLCMPCTHSANVSAWC